MGSIEKNSEDWREIRARVDSIANAVFLISGGALSLSISVILEKKGSPFITKQVSCLVEPAWYLLLSALLIFLLLKVHMIFQAYLLQFNTAFLNKNVRLLNGLGWAIGLIGFFIFGGGMFLMVKAAVIAVNV